jgi:hypothetical protein
MFSLMTAGGVVMLFVDGFALINVGMWTAMTTKRHARAFMSTMLRVMLPPVIAMVLFFFLVESGAISGKNSEEAVLVGWLAIGGVVSFIAAGTAASNLDRNFREIASLGKVESLPQMPGSTS